jgi:hypothetical protein
VVFKGLAGAVVALAAAGGYCQLKLQFAEAGAAALRGAGDVTVRNTVADTNYHSTNVMRIVRISNGVYLTLL